MENKPIHNPDLVAKYLSGEMSEDELQAFQLWLAADPENQKLYEELRNTWVLVEQLKTEEKLDVDSEWNDFTRRINGNYRAFPFLKWSIRIAAAFLILAIPAYFLFIFFDKAQQKIITARNQVENVNLPDGTIVSLNRGTTIEFSENFKGTGREVKLKGEAFFSVKHDEKSRFVIVSGDIRIEDIGTSFYVNTDNADGQMEVVLTEGVAAVYFEDNPGGRVVINPGERVDITAAQKNILKSVNKDENFMAWQTRKLVFSNNTLPEVVALLNKVYQSDIRLQGNNLNNCRLSATFDNQSLESVLNVIKSTLDVSIISRDLHIEISGNTCD